MNIQLHAGQSQIFSDLILNSTLEKQKLNESIRFANACCSRGWGKSVGGATCAFSAAVELCYLDSSVPNKHVYVIAPTYSQAIDIYYPLFKYQLGADAFTSGRDSKADGRFYFPSNVEIRIISYEAVERMRGKGAYFVLWDEVSSCTKGLLPRNAWEDVIEPCILTRWSLDAATRFNARSAGRALSIGTPKGFNYFYDMHNFQDSDAAWKSYHFDYTQSPYISAEEVERVRARMDPIQFSSEYLAQFKESGYLLFYCFDRNIHVRSDVPDFVKPRPEQGLPGEDVHVAIDFNVGIQAASFFALRGHQMHFIDELKGAPNTEALAETIANKYKGHPIYCYPDPTGNSRKTSANVGVTDFTILKKFGLKLRARNQGEVKIVDSTNAVNARLMNARGDVNMFFHPRCVNTITSVERTAWVDGRDTATIDKKEGIEHFSDGVRYATEFLFPINSSQIVVAKSNRF